MNHPESKEPDWAERPSARRKLWIALGTACLLSVLVELIWRVTQQGHSHLTKFFFFYGLVGFISCAALLILSLGMGLLLRQVPDLYDNDDETDG